LANAVGELEAELAKNNQAQAQLRQELEQARETPAGAARKLRRRTNQARSPDAGIASGESRSGAAGQTTADTLAQETKRREAPSNRRSRLANAVANGS